MDEKNLKRLEKIRDMVLFRLILQINFLWILHWISGMGEQEFEMQLLKLLN